jgi:hypothetical protein
MKLSPIQLLEAHFEKISLERANELNSVCQRAVVWSGCATCRGACEWLFGLPSAQHAVAVGNHRHDVWILKFFNSDMWLPCRDRLIDSPLSHRFQALLK